MSLIDIDDAMNHCKASSLEQTTVQLYLDAAEEAAIAYINRNVYVDQDALDTATADVDTALQAANAALNTALEAADALADERDRCNAYKTAHAVYDAAYVQQMRIRNGIVIDNKFRAAVLLIVGNFYRNREESQPGALGSLPMGAQAILDKMMAVADL